MTPTGVPQVVDVARAIVEKMAPEQANEVDFVARVYSPAAARRAHRPSNEPTASVAEVGQAVLAAVALNVTVDICEDLLIAVAKNVAKSGKEWIHRPLCRGKVTPETDVPVLPDEQAELIRKHAVEAAIEHGLAPERAEELAQKLVDSWPVSE